MVYPLLQQGSRIDLHADQNMKANGYQRNHNRKESRFMKNISVSDILWVSKLEECLIPIQEILIIKRGERSGWNALFYPPENSGIESEYIKPALIKPALLKSFMVQSDRAVFCCHKSKEELRQLGQPEKQMGWA